VSREDDRTKVLLASLIHVAFEGWTRRALAMGARDAGFAPDAAERLFPDGIGEAVAHWSGWSDQQMLARLQAPDWGAMRVRQKVAVAVRARIEVNAAEREAVRRTISFLALPWNAALAARCTTETVNAIWYAVGDRATDLRWYTKRALLASVYGATVLFWLDDESDGAAETWAFLDRRIADAMALGSLRGRAGAALTSLAARGSRFGLGRP
jgi:ubiquinone biosynthesis protein COQ9